MYAQKQDRMTSANNIKNESCKRIEKISEQTTKQQLFDSSNCSDNKNQSKVYRVTQQEIIFYLKESTFLGEQDN